MMPLLITDIKNDRRWLRNFLRIIIFLLLFFILDNIVSFTLLKGIDRNYGIKSKSDILMIGHSHLMLAIDKELLENRTGLKVAKYTREGVNIAERKIMLEHYFITCEKKPVIVILSIDPWLFTEEGLSKNSYMLFLPFMDTPEIRDYIIKSVPKKFDYFRTLLIKSSRYNTTLLNASIRGYLKRWDNLKVGTLDSVRLRKEISNSGFRKITIGKELMNDFSGMMDYLNKENSVVILLNTPVWAPLVSYQQKVYDKVMNVIDSIAQNHCPKARVIDLVPRFSNKSEFFFDPIHLNPKGQKIVTEYFSVVLDSIRNSQYEKVRKVSEVLKKVVSDEL